MSEYAVKPLGAATWDAFVSLAEKHNGVWGGCWCTWFHPARARRAGARRRTAPTRNVSFAKARLTPPWSSTATSRWPGIYHLKEYNAGRTGEPPDYRLTCFFVDRDYRRRGVAAVALRGALDLIAKAGGGVVEAYPQDTKGKENVGLLSLQRHAASLRAGRLPLRAAQAKEPLRHRTASPVEAGD